MTPTLKPFRIRRAVASDAPLLSSIATRLFEETFGPDNSPEDMRAYVSGAFSVARQTEELTDPHRAAWIVINDSGEAIGYALLRRGSRADGVAASRPAEIQRIYADRGWHGLGVGSALMDACVEQARAWGCDGLWLAVWERNPRAIAFYEKTGFSKVGRAIFKLGSDVQHDDVMCRSLS